MVTNISPIEEIINEAKAGKMFILVDDENRENEGDVVVAAEFATAEVINFMVTHARGLVCLALDEKIIERLEIPMQYSNHLTKFDTAFTTSIEARYNVTTGISAYDRAETIKVAIDPKSTNVDIAMPGHIFPIKAKNGGVLERAGHTEASVDIAKISGLTRAAVICEILNENGTMARLPELEKFSQKHNIKIGLIKDLISYVKNK